MAVEPASSNGFLISQAAMEFLLNYGWALVILITVLAAWAYFGNDSVTGLAAQFLPAKCQFQAPGLHCIDHSVSVYSGFFGDENRLEMNVKNNLGEKIQIEKIVIPTFQNKEQTFLNLVLENGEQTHPDENPITINDLDNGQPIIRSGETYDFDVIFTIVHDQSKLTHELTARLRSKVN